MYTVEIIRGTEQGARYNGYAVTVRVDSLLRQAGLYRHSALHWRHDAALADIGTDDLTVTLDLRPPDHRPKAMT